MERARWIDEAAERVRAAGTGAPRVCVILGTGLGGFARELLDAVAVPYAAIPHFPRSTALSHAGRLVCGRLGAVPVIAMEGRVHLYEGYEPAEICFPLEVCARLGARTLVVTNASGGLNPRLASEEVLVVSGHIDLMGRRAREAAMAADNSLATRSPTGCYDRQLIELALSVARREGFPASEGTYVGMSGPNYETRAEYRFLRRIGGDVVGMSTIPEVRTARRLGLRCLALSVVTNVASTDVQVTTTPEDVVAAANRASMRIGSILRAAIADG
ncbi:MAG: Purine nucleoside phosphorylase 1 [Planctomycetota bacterium]|jgi:purine-nucleoside phosphorylase